MKSEKEIIIDLAKANAELACANIDLQTYHDAQAIIAQAVTNRGYRTGWTNDQFIARQVVKLGEELGELAATVNLPIDAICLIESGGACRELFDSNKVWRVTPSQTEIEQAKKEAADILVVLFNLAESIALLTGKPFDLIGAAIEKATHDQKRGVR